MITFILFIVTLMFVVATLVFIIEGKPASVIAAFFAIIIGLAWHDRAFAPDPAPSAEQVAQREATRLAEEALRTPQQLSAADGCTVYKFKDNGYWHYFTKCEKDVTTDTTRSVRVGKSNQTKIESIVTQR